jgi:DNA-binding SARP family transcriptional activator
MVIKEKPISRGSAEGRSNWYEAFEFLKAGQYEQAAEYLQTAIVTTNRTDDGFLVDILAAAHRICLVCSQCQAEVAWHRRACKEANRREQELRRQVCAILDSVSGHHLTDKQELRSDPFDVPLPELDPPESDPSKPVSRLSLWQRTQSLLGLRPQLQPPESEERKAVAPALPAPLVEDDEQSGPSLAVYCLGPLRVYSDDKLIEKWPGHKCKTIFKYLIAHRERPIHQEILMDLLWPEADPDAARRNLYQAIYSLRQALQSNGSEFPHILCEENCYRLNPELELWVDSEVFSQYYQTGQQLERKGHMPEAIKAYESAEMLYEGEFLAEDIYEDWLLVQRENLKFAHLDILDRLSRYYFEQAQLAMCIGLCQKILTKDNCREDAHRRLMRCYLRQGQRHLALRQYHLCVEALEAELAVPPMPATDELYQKIQISRNQF